MTKQYKAVPIEVSAWHFRSYFYFYSIILNSFLLLITLFQHKLLQKYVGLFETIIGSKMDTTNRWVKLTQYMVIFNLKMG